MTQQDVANLIDNAKPFEQVGGEPTPVVKLKRFHLQHFDAIKPNLEEEWLVQDILPKNGVAIVYGASQSYKTFLLLDLTTSIASNASYWGSFRIDNPDGRACVYVAAEGMAGAEKRIAAIKSQRKIRSSSFYLVKARPALGRDRESDKDELVSEIKLETGNNVAVVVIDTLSQCLGGGEENGGGMQAIIGAATDIATALNCVVILVHHTGHQGKEPRGHSSALGNPDTLLLLENDGCLRSSVTIRKQKDGATGLAFSVNLKEVELGRDKYNEPVKTLVVAEVGNKEIRRPQGKNLKKGEQTFMKQFEIALRDGSKEIRPIADGPKVSAVLKDALKEKYFAANAHQEPATRRRNFDRTLQGLVESGYLASCDVEGAVYLWKSRNEEVRQLRGLGRDNRDTLKGVVPSVPLIPETKRDIVPDCPVVPPQTDPPPFSSWNTDPRIEGVVYRDDGSVLV